MARNEQNPGNNAEAPMSFGGDYYECNPEATDSDQIKIVWRCGNCYAGLAWMPWQYKPISGAFLGPALCDNCKDRALGVTDQVTLDFVRERHPYETCTCGACMHLRAVAA